MESKHFSHTHGLIVHQVPGGSEITCSGCKFPGTGSVYACWPCGYFLHEQCFHATRSMNHASHQTHPLTLVPYPTYPSNSFFCNSCNLVGSGLSYSCSNCDFDLHVHCAFMPSTTTTYDSYPPSMNLNYPIPEKTTPQNNPIPIYPPQNYETMPNFIAPMGGPVADQYQTSQPQYVSYPSGDQIPKNNFFPNEPVNNPVPIYHPHHYEPSPSFNAQMGGTAGTTQVVDRPQAIPPQGYPSGEAIPPQGYPNGEAVAPQGYPSEDLTPMKKQIKHFSHRHPLRVTETREEDSIVCSGCEEVLSGPSYSCITSKCNFNLHKSCFELERVIKHDSHTEHNLVLLPSPPYKEHGDFTCNACLKAGSAFTYHCKTCQYDLHVNCAYLPKSVKRPDHEHTLVLFYSSQLKKLLEEKAAASFSCDVCLKVVDERGWVYYCQKCDFGTHLECIGFAQSSSQEQQTQNCSHEQTQVESLLEAQKQPSGGDGLSANIAVPGERGGQVLVFTCLGLKERN
ncbi:hypothetical protein LguiB_011165 [Lonicera macranthoides]